MNDTASIRLPLPGPACAGFADLLPLLDEDMPGDDEAQRLRQHLGTCAYCQMQRAIYDRIADALSRYGEPPEASPFSAEELLQITQDAPPAPDLTPPLAGWKPAVQAPTPPLAPTGMPAAHAGVVPVPPAGSQRRRRVRRVVSVFSALAAALVIAILATTLFASHHPTVSSAPVKHTPTPGQPGIPLSVYLTSNSYPNFSAQHASQSTLLALNASDGSVRWRRDTSGVTMFPPILYNGVLYTGTGDGTVYAFSASDGAVLWRFQALLRASVAAVVNGVVYVGADDAAPEKHPIDYYTYALNASNGQLLWRFTQGDRIGPVVDGTVYVLSDPGMDAQTLYALNASDGSVRWTYQGNALNVWAVAGGVVYTTSTQTAGRNMNPFNTLHALDASTGKERWSFPRGGGAEMDFAGTGDGVIYLASNEGRGDESPDAVYALNTSNGSVRWRVAPGMVSGALLNNGVFYIGSEDQALLALNASTGSTLWRVTLDEPAVPFVAGNGLLAVNAATYPEPNWSLAILNASNGSVRWRYTGEPLKGAYADALMNGILYARAFDNSHSDHPINPTTFESSFLALNASDGTLKWNYTIGQLPNFSTLSVLVG